MGLISAIKGHGATSHATPEHHHNTSGETKAGAVGSDRHTSTAGATPAKEYCATQNAPVVHENLRQQQSTHITPVVDREREETIVQQTIQPIEDRVQAETQHHYSQAKAISRETAEELSAEDARRYQAQRELVGTGSRNVERIDRGVVENAPIVKERVNTHVIEEIQPVVNRTIEEQHIVHTEQPIYEHHTAAPKVAEVRTNAPLTMEEFEKRGGSMTGTGLHCERRT